MYPRGSPDSLSIRLSLAPRRIVTHEENARTDGISIRLLKSHKNIQHLDLPVRERRRHHGSTIHMRRCPRRTLSPPASRSATGAFVDSPLGQPPAIVEWPPAREATLTQTDDPRAVHTPPPPESDLRTEETVDRPDQTASVSSKHPDCVQET